MTKIQNLLILLTVVLLKGSHSLLAYTCLCLWTQLSFQGKEVSLFSFFNKIKYVKLKHINYSFHQILHLLQKCPLFHQTWGKYLFIQICSTVTVSWFGFILYYIKNFKIKRKLQHPNMLEINPPLQKCT